MIISCCLYSPKHVRWSIDLESDRQAAIHAENYINLTSKEQDEILSSETTSSPPIMNMEYTEPGSNMHRQERLTRYVELYAARAGRRTLSNEDKVSSDEKLSCGSFESPTSHPLTSTAKSHISSHIMDKKGAIFDRKFRGRKDDMRRLANFKLMNAGRSKINDFQHDIWQRDFNLSSDSKRQTPPSAEKFIAQNARNILDSANLKNNHFRSSQEFSGNTFSSDRRMIPKQITPLRQNVAALQRRSVSPLRSKSLSPPMKTLDLTDDSKVNLKKSPERGLRFSNVRHRYYPISPTSMDCRNDLLYVQKAGTASGLPKAKTKHTRSHTAPSYLSQGQTSPLPPDTSYLANTPKANWQELRKQRLQSKKRRLLPSTPITPDVKQNRNDINVATLLDTSLEVLGRSKAQQFSPHNYR